MPTSSLVQPVPRGATKDAPFRVSDLPTSPVITSVQGLSPEQVAAAFAGKSVKDIKEAFEAEGYTVKVTLSTSSSSSTPPTQLEIKGTATKKLSATSITQIEFHPGGGIHGGAYYRLSTNSPAKYKVIDPTTYVPPKSKERFEYIWVDGVDGAMPKAVESSVYTTAASTTVSSPVPTSTPTKVEKKDEDL
jgi:hypothetical protein